MRARAHGMYACTHACSHPNSNSPQSSIVSTMGLRPWIIIIRKTDVRKRELSPLSTTRALPRNSILKTSNHPTIPWIVLLHGSLRIACVCKRGGEGRGGRGKREMVGLTHTQRRHNCERRRVTRVGSRRSPWALAAGYAFVQQAFIPSRCATYAIMNASVSLPLSLPSPACFPRGTFQYVVHSRWLCPHEISASRRRAIGRIPVQFSLKLRRFVLCCR